MKNFALKNVAAAAGAVLALAAGNAFATPEFTINQGAITGGTYQNPQMFTGTQFSGNSSELVRFSAGDTNVNVSSGFLRFSTIFNENTSSGVGLNTSSFAGNYGLYLLFNFSATYNAGASSGNAAGTPGSQYDITALSFTVYADTVGNTTFQNANAAGAGTEATRTGGFADDVVLGFGSLLSTANPDVAGFNSGGGAFENALTSFAICTGAGTARVGSTDIPGASCTNGEGINYFAQPVPYYPLAFNAFNNTGNSLGARVGNNLAILQSVGAVSFQAVPEPSSIALFGIAAVALGVSARRRRKA